MKKLVKAVKTSLAFLLCAAMLAGCGSAQKTGTTTKKDDDDYKITLKLSHVFQPDEQVYKTMEQVGKRITEKTDGHVNVEVYGQGQLAVYEDALEQVKRGANFISVEEPSYLGAFVPDFAALVGPCLYRNYDEWEAMGKTDLVKNLVKQAEEKGIHILSLNYEFGFRSLCTNRDVKKPEDLSGVKLRSTKSPLFIKTINAMGGVATPMSFTECISAIQSGVVEGFEGSEFTLKDTGAWEVVKKVALTNHFIAVRGVYINSDVYKNIPEKYRKIIDEEFDTGAKECRKAVEASYEETVSYLKDNGVTFNEVDVDAFTKACNPVYDWLVEESGCTKGIHEKLLSELDKIRKK